MSSSMDQSMSPESRLPREASRPLRTSDLASAGTPPPAQDELEGEQRQDREERHAISQPQAVMADSQKLEALFPPQIAAQYRGQWAEVQSGFVDDPQRAVAKGDELVAQVMKNLAESFAHEREMLEDELSSHGEASTETLRLGLRRYRSFFERLLSL